MENPDGHFYQILFYYFRKVKNAVQAREKLYDVYGEKSLTERQRQNWFARFRSGDHGASEMSLHNQHQKPIFIKRRLC